MRQTRPSGARLGIAALIVLLTGALGGCGVLLTSYADLPSNDKDNDLTELAPESDVFLVEMARKFGLMALFAEVAYRRDIAEDLRDGRGCAYLDLGDSDSPEARFGMPQSREEKGGWKRWIPPAGDRAVRACLDEDGLYYETYLYENAAGRIEEAVIAFRGTENRWGQYWSDWSANIVSALGFEPKQYALARKHLPALILALRGRFERDQMAPKMYAVGHSLGGGLAQQAGYLSKDIAEVFTFNTSPVTNWTHLRLAGKIGNAYPIIHRIYHGGEFLEKVRFITTSVTQARYGRHDIGLQLVGRNDFKGHSMKIIACNFAELISTQKDVRAADHHYSSLYIREVVLRQEADAGGERQLICAKLPAS